MSAVIRDARDDDAEALIAMIGACYGEHPGCILDVDGESPELRAIASHFARLGGRFWVAGENGRLVGSAGVAPGAEPNTMELHRLYVDRSQRRRGLATRLVVLIEDEARERGATRLDLFTDTRFTAAHRLYERLGFVRAPGTRTLDDRSRSVEYRFFKVLTAEP